MIKGVKLLILMGLLVLCFNFVVSETSVSDEMKRVTYYAEQYETGNINYVQLVVYLGSVREKMNEVLGVVNKKEGGVLSQDQIKGALGEPDSWTKWVWVSGEEHDKRMDEEVPVWKRSVFDGNKIRIQIEAHPSVIKKGRSMDDESLDFDSEGQVVVYHLNFFSEFKTEKEEFDWDKKIDDVGELAEIFQSDSSRKNGEILAEESVNVERSFESFLRQKSEKCESVMDSIFGLENKREVQKMHVQEFELYGDDRVSATARLEMCEDCEWSWVNLNIWVDGRGMFMGEKKRHEEDFEKYKGLSWEEYESEIRGLINKMKASLNEGDYESVFSDSNKLMILNNGWNEIANNVWDDVEKIFEAKRKKSENMGEGDPYYWIKENLERRKMSREMADKNLERRKAFYDDLFSDYDKKEFYFEQMQWEKRLIEEFRSFRVEVCDNNKDDNDDGAVDCTDSSCGGKFCGKLVSSGVVLNETVDNSIDLFCISSVCQPKEESLLEEVEEVCGNHICGLNETVDNCQEDCSSCPVHEAIECAGDVIFKGWDEDGCSLAPVCIEEVNSCEVTEDCVQPLCGVAECVLNVCEVVDLEKCREAECVDGDEDVEKCQNGEKIISEKCLNGLWMDTGLECVGDAIEEVGCTSCGDECVTLEFASKASCLESSENFECVSEGSECEKVVEEVFGSECSVISDCGGENDVCSNGECVSLPEVTQEDDCSNVNCENEEECVSGVCVFLGEEEEEVYEEEGWEDVEEELEKEKMNEEESEKEEGKEEEMNTGTTGNFILDFFGVVGSLFSITGNVVDSEGEAEASSGDESENDDSGKESSDSGSGEETDDSESELGGSDDESGSGEGDYENDDNYVEELEFENHEEDNNNWEEENEKRENEENERREEEDRKREEDHKKEKEEHCKKDCERRCGDEILSRCVNDCVFVENSDKVNDFDECKKQCDEEKGGEIKDCLGSCLDNCKNDDWGKIDKSFEKLRNEDEEKHKEQVGVFQVGGSCRTERQETQGNIWFGGWGEPFEKLEPLKRKYYNGGDADWCKRDLENYVHKRKEFERGFNSDFVVWFFDEYVASSAGDWESQVSGIHELYWDNVNMQREFAHRMQCVGLDNISDLMDIELIEVKYETPYGSIEYWEELDEVEMQGVKGKVTVISPYMKFWMFPPKKFLISEMQDAMKNHEFPGSGEKNRERENEDGLTPEEIEKISKDDGLMKKIRKVTKKYDGEADVVVEFKDSSSGEVVFNLHVEISEEKIFKMTPILPEEVSHQDIKVEVDFDTLYDFIYDMESGDKNMRIESPPWAKKRKGAVGVVKDVVGGIGMYLKVRRLVKSVEVTPKSDASEVRSLAWAFMKIMGDDEDEKNREGEDEKGEGDVFEDWDNKGKSGGMKDGEGKGPLSQDELAKLKEELGEEEFDEFMKMKSGEEKKMFG